MKGVMLDKINAFLTVVLLLLLVQFPSFASVIQCGLQYLPAGAPCTVPCSCCSSWLKMQAADPLQGKQIYPTVGKQKMGELEQGSDHRSGCLGPQQNSALAIKETS